MDLCARFKECVRTGFVTMKSLVELAVFVRVVESRNLSGAARALGITPSAVSKRLSKLEERLGVTLLHRTTRNVSLSEDGRLFYERCKRILADVQDAERAVAHGRTEVKGIVRLAVPCVVAREVLVGRLPQLLSANPDLTLELSTPEHDADPMKDGVDVALTWGRPPDSALIQRKLTTSKVKVYGATSYFARRGVPKTPEALLQHDCLMAGGAEKGWHFRSAGREVVVPVKSRLWCTSPDAVKELVLAGLGLAREPELLMQSAVAQGLVTSVLDDYAFEEVPLVARCAPSQPLSPRVRVVMDWLVDVFH
jgi:LysR family transcriptional regulator, regulator for bpeEF and oprC